MAHLNTLSSVKMSECNVGDLIIYSGIARGGVNQKYLSIVLAIGDEFTEVLDLANSNEGEWKEFDQSFRIKNRRSNSIVLSYSNDWVINVNPVDALFSPNLEVATIIVKGGTYNIVVKNNDQFQDEIELNLGNFEKLDFDGRSWVYFVEWKLLIKDDIDFEPIFSRVENRL